MSKDDSKDDIGFHGGCMTRRAFLFRSGAVAVSTVMLAALAGMAGMSGEALAAEMARYPGKKIGKFSALKAGEPVTFNYPDNGPNSQSTLVRLGAPAGGGIGPDQDVVAFNSLCPHMGGPAGSMFHAAEQAATCPLHQTIFDLTRHGMVVAGHATESLPQVLLELKGDDIYAVGIIGLIYGRHNNLKSA